MNAHIDYQIIENNGEPEYAVVPYKAFMKLLEDESNVSLPSGVTKLYAVEGLPIIKAWRKHLDITQAEMADRMGISQPGYQQIEIAETPQRGTLEKVADALGIEVAKLTEL